MAKQLQPVVPTHSAAMSAGWQSALWPVPWRPQYWLPRQKKHKKDLRNDSLQEKGHSGVFLSYSVEARRQFKIMFAFIRFMRTK